MPNFGYNISGRMGFRSKGAWNPNQFSKTANGNNSTTKGSFWLRGDLGTSTTVNGAAVSSWTDQIGSIALTQGTGAQQPLYVTSSINSKPALSFTNAANKLLASASSFGLLTGSNQTYCYWVVLVVDSIATDNADAVAYSNVGVFNDGNNNYQGMYLKSTGPTVQSYFYRASAATASTTTSALGTAFFFRGRHVNTGSDLTSTVHARVNRGTEVTTIAGASAGGGGTIQVGAGAGGSITGRIAEIFVLPRTATATEFTLADQYLHSRYNI